MRFSEQAKDVADLWTAAGTCTTLLDDHATAEALGQAAGRFDVLHLSCHGTTSSGVHDPMDSSRLELAGGILTAREALAWSLRADLVFMNVCQGGRFRMEGRSNVSGFLRAFHAAGALRDRLGYPHRPGSGGRTRNPLLPALDRGNVESPRAAARAAGGAPNLPGCRRLGFPRTLTGDYL